jgi:hypothetical protein
MQGSARALWRLLAGGAAGIDEVTDALLASYAETPPSAAEDVRAFVDRLVEHQLLRGAANAAVTPAPLNEDQGRYAPPVVEAFTDMQELVLLDPVHDVGAAGWPNRPAGE